MSLKQKKLYSRSLNLGKLNKKNSGTIGVVTTILSTTTPLTSSNVEQTTWGYRDKTGRSQRPKGCESTLSHKLLNLDRAYLRSQFIKQRKPAKTYGKRFRHELRQFIIEAREAVFGYRSLPDRNYKSQRTNEYNPVWDQELAERRFIANQQTQTTEKAA